MLLRYFLVRKKKVWLLISPFSSWLQTRSYSRATGLSGVAGSTLRFSAGNTNLTFVWHWKVAHKTGVISCFFFLIQYQTMRPFKKSKLLSIQLYGTKSSFNFTETAQLWNEAFTFIRDKLPKNVFSITISSCWIQIAPEMSSMEKQTKLLIFFPL